MEKVKHHYKNDYTFIWDKVNGCEMNVPWLVFMEVKILLHNALTLQYTFFFSYVKQIELLVRVI